MPLMVIYQLIMYSCCVHRGLPAGIYETYNSNTCHLIADNCKASIIVVENQTQQKKILKVSVVLYCSFLYWELHAQTGSHLTLLSPVIFLVSSEFGSIISVDAICFEDRFCAIDQKRWDKGRWVGCPFCCPTKVFIALTGTF